MLKIFAIAVAITLMLPSVASAHGGGCRKNSPSGQCCHMEKKVGRVHCH